VQTGLILGFHDVGYWALIAAAASLVIALLSGVGAHLRTGTTRPVVAGVLGPPF